MNKKLKLSIFCIVVCGLVGLMASPAAAVTVLWQAANTDISLGLPFNDLEFENPLAGTEMVKEYAVLEWRDADYAAGTPPWYDDWTVSDPTNIDGNINEIWMRQRDQWILTATTVASNAVSIHLVGDNNDGLADVLVDGVVVAKLNMNSSAAQTALIIVKDLANTPHTVTVKDMGLSPSGPSGTDVATLGAAALEKRIKWSQPPVPAQPKNIYYGWNEPSEYNGNHIVADDWVCNTDDPVTDIHWWGSYVGWKFGQEPPVTPSSFHITFWTDVPVSAADDFSHPGVVVHEIECTNFTPVFDGWDYDPRTESYEACFKYVQILDETEYFFQKPNPPGEAPNIYWISIAAKYPTTVDVEHPWGWKTRPHDSSMAPDDAVRIFDPIAPHINDQYITGEPIEYPAGRSWDMAFELTARPVIPYTKWSQKPKFPLQGGPCYYGWDEFSQFGSMMPNMRQIVADDWVCDTKDPVKDIHWWGSYIGWTEDMPPQPPLVAPDQFHIGVWTDVPVGPIDNFSHPGKMIWEWVVDRSELQEIYDGCDEHELIPPPGRETCFYYEYKIPEGQWFYQEPTPDGTPTTYWLSISAMYAGVIDLQFPWGWKTRERDMDSRALDDAVRIFDPTAPDLGLNNRYITGEPIWWPEPENSWDTAFELTSTRYGPEYVKWSQPPEPYNPPDAINGWDEWSVYNRRVVADDWFCDTDDPVSDIHWWGSFIGWSERDLPPVMPDAFHIAIWTDVQPGPFGGNFSHPGTVIWETVCREFTVDFEGWDFDPRQAIGTIPMRAPDACFKFEQDIPIDQWFRQKPGGNIYWVSIAAMYPAGTIVENPWGWKVRPRDPDSLAPDDAVRIFDPSAPVLNSLYVDGEPIYWPNASNSWDTCFELTTKKIPPKKPVPHLKWSQPPIEVDPDSRIPVYSGWDEISYIDQIDTTRDPLVADDYRCLGSMPVTSIHWWGSHYGFVEPGTAPPVKPIGWKIGFWSNVPKGAVADYSYPEKMLWEVKVPADRVEVEEVGTDFYHDFYPEDIAYQYTLYLGPNEVFWQGDYLDDTKDDVFWLSIAAIYSPDIAYIPYPWGWKTRPWSWMDDAVRFTFDSSLEPGIVLDPIDITPIKDPLYNESFDVAFELDTDPNYIKWEQPFTGIRRWPHYEDEKSMARVVTTTENVIKWIQKPDLTDRGVDVDATLEQMVPPPSPQLLADDFPCDTSEPITGINIYGSWLHDNLPHDPTGLQNPAQVQFTLSFHEDLPIGDPRNPNPWSMPGDMIWSERFVPGEFSVEPITAMTEESYYIPCTDEYFPNDHMGVYKYNFYPKDPFVQKGSPDNPVIYWLDVQAQPQDVQLNPLVRFGWKTRDLDDGHFMDDATWVRAVEPYNGNEWRELRYPPGHPYAEQSMDLAFELTTNRVTTELIIDSLVADDWKCEGKTPVTDAVWWGSYIGYEYKPCHGEFMPLPVKPDYFLLNIWSDVPADTSSTVPFSHPNEMLWEYRAYEYDEVLVGYDKHPHAGTGINVAICGAPSDPSWNNDVQAKLLATGQFNSVDIITVNTITPTLAQLQAYDSVLVYSDAIYADANALGNVMADYVDAGGGVVCAMFEIGYGSGPNPHPTAQMKGRWDRQGYYVIPRTAQHGPPQATLGPVYDPTHPIMQGVSTFDGGTTSARPTPATIIPPGATRIADWSDQSPLVVTKTIAGVPRADLGLYPPSSDSRSDFWVSSTDGALLMANALSWVAGSGPTVSRRREPVFRYSVRLPKDDWFLQKDVNDIYWFSVVAVYESGTDPLYDWGWTNHKHVFNDDAVAGYLDPAVGEWFWNELYDQTGNSEDMSFVLFTEPGCFPCAHPDYFEWLLVGKPDCWCYPRQCRGDADDLPYGKKNCWVSIPDLAVLKAAWNKPLVQIQDKTVFDVNPGCTHSCNVSLICADFDHKPYGKKNSRVSIPDLTILKANWNIPNGPDPNCFAGY